MRNRKFLEGRIGELKDGWEAKAKKFFLILNVMRLIGSQRLTFNILNYKYL
ncbi:MAG: hypothetical protein M0P12_06320 [Paludibacteraceae bacterium]|nr:hypothetical protein [Paludibacteraceae bacterium]